MENSKQAYTINGYDADNYRASNAAQNTKQPLKIQIWLM